MTCNRRPNPILIVFVILMAFLASGVFAAAWPALAPEDAKNIMPVSQVKRGMRGYGLTVFQGVKIEKFDVEVLGVLKKANTGRDLILVRVGGGPITSRQTSIMQGMSGSPVYVNGKMIGAVAYGTEFNKEPVGMLTPVADMLEAWDPNLPKHPSGHSTADLENPIKVDGKSVSKIDIDETGERSGVEDGTLFMRPLMMPMMVSGVSAKGMEKLAEILKPFHIQPMAGLGGGPKKGIKAELVPGAAVGVSLASGDIDMSGTGTVTYRRGNRIVAFGHPMLGIGSIDAPMTTAYIEDVMSSYRISSKMSSPLETVGRIFQDRPWSIAGRLGDMPKTIPVTVVVDDQMFGRSRTFHVNIINHPLLASRIATLVVSEAIYNVHPAPGDATAEISYDVNADQLGSIKRSNVFFDPASIDGVSISDIGNLMMILSSNKFSPVDIKSVKVNAKIVGKRNTATIDRIFLKKGEFEPGETVDIGVVLRPYKKDRITKTLSVKIPATAADGKVTVSVRGGAAPAALAMSVGDDDGGVTLGAAESGIASADNVKQLVDKYLEKEKNNEIVVQLGLRSTAINVAGEKLTGMPNAIADVMKSSRNSGLKLERDDVKKAFPEDMIIYGSARLSLDVKKKSLKEAPSAPKAEIISPADDETASPTVTMSDYELSSYSSSLDGSGPMAIAIEEKPSDDSIDCDIEEDDADEADTPATDATAKTDDAKPATPAEVAPASKSDVKTVVRKASTWSQRSQADFLKGKFSGVSASSKDKLELSPVLRKLAETSEQFVWCLAHGKNGVYAGTGNSGKIYTVSDTGDLKLFYETGELEVHSLVVDSKGNVYAATSPSGKIFKITPDGKGSVLYKTAEKYVISLALDGDGNLYAGVGDAGKVYRILSDGKGNEFANINEQQILSLYWDSKANSLLAGTGINGVVYRIASDGSAKPIFDAAENSITSVISDSVGNVYAGTSPKGAIYQIAPDGRSKVIYAKAARVLSMARDSHNNIYAVSDSSLLRIAPDGSVTMLDSASQKVQYLALAYNDASQTLYAGTGNIGEVYISKCCDVMGEYESPVHDTKMISKWGRIKWDANIPEGTRVTVRTRTGNVETPDSTWSNWSAPYTNNAGEQISGASARYIQYQVTLATGKADASPKLSSVTLSYLTPNQAPTVKLTAPAGGDVWGGKKTIRWAGSDPDKDSLSYDVFYSNDGGKSWNALVGGASGAKASTESKPDAAAIKSKVKNELAKTPEVPEDMKAALLKGDKNAPAVSEEAPAASASKPATSSKYNWDTKKVADGNYLVKVVVSDKISNGANALSDEVISSPIAISNKAPEVRVNESKGIQVKAGGAATLTGSAVSKMLDIMGVQYRIDGGEWESATPSDGIFDSPAESYTLNTGSLSVGDHKVEIQAIDAAGNAASVKVDAKVS